MPAPRHHIFASFAVALCLLLTSTGWADEPDEPLDSDEEFTTSERAQQAFDRGASLYYAGDYADAIVAFRHAHEARPHPIFLYNIARASQALQRHGRAMDAALEAMELSDDADDASEKLPADAYTYLSALVTGLDVHETSIALSPKINAARAAMTASRPAEEESPTPSRLGGRGLTGLATVGIGAAALGGAAVLDLRLRSQIDDLNEQRSTITMDAYQDERDFIDRRQSTGVGLLIGGAALIGAGSILLITDLADRSDDATLSLSPSLHRPGVHLDMRW